MRLVIDLQACETDSRDRGIGRYAMSLVKAIAAALEAGDTLIIAIDMADARRMSDVRAELRAGQVQADVVAYGYPVTPRTDASPAARKLAGQLRARFYASLQPDVLLISSLFETEEMFTTELDWQALDGVPTAVVGYDLIPLVFPDRYLPTGQMRTGWYHARVEDLRRFDLVLSISDATQRDLVAFLGMPEGRIKVIGAGFDAALTATCDDPTVAQARLRALGIERPFVLMVSNRDWRKNTEGALRAFAHLPRPLRDAHDLVLTQVDDDVLQSLQYEHSGVRDHVHVLGRVDDATLALLYAECRVLYFPSYYEGFGLPVLEAMALNSAVLCANTGALPEVVHDPQALFDPHARRDGEALLAKALSDDAFREQLRRGARDHALTFTWDRVAQKAVDALRSLAARTPRLPKTRSDEAWPDDTAIQLMADVWLDAGPTGGRAMENGLRAIARHGRRRVLVDLSEIVRLDARTGVQRVTRNFFTGLAALAKDSGRFDVEPICWTEGEIRYARSYARDKLGVSCAGPDEPVRVEPSDLAFMLDSSWWSPERFDELHTRVQVAGGEVVWMVHDLIPIRFPQTCDPGMPPAFTAWLAHAIRTSDGFICNSDATRHDLDAFIDEVSTPGVRRPWAQTVYLGCDRDAKMATHPSERATALLASLGVRSYFVALGTLEPRKDCATIIDAFELLWARGIDTALVIVGKQGWNVAELATRIQQHPEYERRLFWLQGLGDADVRYLLEHSKGLIQASIWEGFGLPLIEAGSQGVPLIASDIAVFHEVAGAAAAYFPVGDAAALADVVAAAGPRGEGNAAPLNVRPRPWRDASANLAHALLASPKATRARVTRPNATTRYGARQGAWR